MGELTAEHLAAQDVRADLRRQPRLRARACELAERFGGEAVQFEAIEPHLPRCDIVIASTARAALSSSSRGRSSARSPTRKQRNLFLIDLSVPRNIDPAIAQIDGAYLYNIDDLQHVADVEPRAAQKKAQQAEEIVVARSRRASASRLVAQDAVPTILELQQRLEEIRAAELEKCLRKLGPIDAGAARGDRAC